MITKYKENQETVQGRLKAKKVELQRQENDFHCEDETSPAR